MAGFYEAAFGFVPTDEVSICEPAFAELAGIPGARARVVTLRLGEQEIGLASICPPGKSYPGAVPGPNPLFQHFATVVSDMATAYARLLACAGWKTISTDGPQLLPAFHSVAARHLWVTGSRGFPKISRDEAYMIASVAVDYRKPLRHEMCPAGLL